MKEKIKLGIPIENEVTGETNVILRANEIRIVEKAFEEIERLNNIISELDRWLKEQENNSTYPSMIFIGSARYKLQELKGSDK